MKKVYTYIVAFFFMFGLLFDYAQAVEHSVNLGSFKCPIAPKENEKIAIFKLIRPQANEFNDGGRESAHYDDATHHPRPEWGIFFCVTVARDKVYAEWTDMVNGVNVVGEKVILGSWGDEDVVKQFRDDGIWKYEGENITAMVERRCEGVDNEPDDLVTKYAFTQTTSVDGDSMRSRYYFCGLQENPNEVFVYFMKIAESGDYPPTNTSCQSSHGANADRCNADAACVWWVAGAKCISKTDNSTKCSDLDPATCAKILHCKLGSDSNSCVDRIVQMNTSEAVGAFISSTYKKPDGYDGPLPDCVWDGSCRKLEDLVMLGVNVAEWIFSVVAGLAFVFFVYGGITMIMSFGNAEKVTRGKQILVAATIGLVITFSAYVLIGFVVKAIGIQSNLLPF